MSYSRMSRQHMPRQLKEYVGWSVFRNGGLAIFFFLQTSFLEEDSWAKQLFRYMGPRVWAMLMVGVAVLSLAAIVKSNMLLARLAFTASMGVTLLLTGTILQAGIFEAEVAPFLTLFLITFVGKDFAMARMPQITLVEDDRQRKGDAGS